MNGRLIMRGLKTMQRAILKRSETICMVGAITALGVTIVETIKAVPEVEKIYKNKKKDYDSCKEDDDETRKEIIWEGVKEAAPIVLKPVIAGTSCLIFIVGQNVISHKKQAILMAAYTLSDEALRDTNKYLDEIVNRKKADEVKEAVKQERAERFQGNGIVETGHGTQLFFMDSVGVWFRSNVDYIHRIASETNSDIDSYDQIDFKEFLENLGLENCKYGDMVGWDKRNGERVEVNMRNTTMYVDRISGYQEAAIIVESNETPFRNMFG